ncbi:MAG TPA: serine hydrolase domain-containing protein [Rhodanobacteraceae bacterium]|nr:serine hydrolase domain-containing protein [Rhodanobacteraceae bacterium]
MFPMKWLSATLLAFASLTASAQTNPPASTTPLSPPATPAESNTIAAKPAESQAAKPLTAEDVNAWLDGYMPYAMATGDVAGAVVAVVKDGQIVTERGFGYANVEKKAPVDPKLTLFRPGSTSKLFTWTAVMQLVEQGKLDLDADVNKYLPAEFQIAPRDGKPITLRNIMTHTAGFEEQIKNIITEDPTQPGYVDLLKRWTPTRVFDPGTTPAYSNYATSLAGYVVERVSGESFYDYIDKHIFAPLDMKHSTFRQPLPKELEPLMSTGYIVASGEAKKFEIVGPAPAGSLSSSGEDMAHFMIAHLQNGEYQGNRILKEETARLMHDSPLTLLPPLNRMELGFFETNINGREVIAHLGDTQEFHTSLHLFLKENTGFYVSFNSAGKEGASHHLRIALFEDFADRYFPGPPLTSARVDEATAKQHAQQMAGNWTASRGAFTTFMSAIGLIGQTKIVVGPKGELVLPDAKGLNGQPVKWVEIAPFVWQDANGHDQLAAKVEDGKVTRFSYGLAGPFEVFLRVDAARNGAWLVPALCVSLAALLLTVVFWPVTAIVRRRYRARLDLPPEALRVYRFGKIGALLSLAGLLSWTLAIVKMFGDLNNTTSAFDPVIRFCQIFGSVAFVAGFLLALWNLVSVWTGKRRWPAKLWSVVLVFSTFIVLWIAFVFHLISWGVNY